MQKLLKHIGISLLIYLIVYLGYSFVTATLLNPFTIIINFKSYTNEQRSILLFFIIFKHFIIWVQLKPELIINSYKDIEND